MYLLDTDYAGDTMIWPRWTTLRRGCERPMTFCVNVAPMRDSRLMLARHSVWLSVREPRRGCIAETTPWTSTFKVSQFNRSADGTIDRELLSWIQKASGAFYQLGSICHSRNIRTPTN
jgi:hypothetical protein